MFVTTLLVSVVLMLAAEMPTDASIAPTGIGSSLFIAELTRLLVCCCRVSP